jgi:CHAT domain-containing protein
MASAEELYWSGEFDSARVVLREVLAAARLQADTSTEARVLTWLGLADWRLGEYQEARRLGEAALDLKLTAGLGDQLFRSYNALGLVAWNEARLSDAVSLFDQAAQAARAGGDERALASVAANLALVNQDLGRFTEARSGFEAVIAAGRSQGDARIEGNGHNNLGALEIVTGDPTSAIEHLEEARRLYASVDYVTGLQNCLGQLSAAYADLGDPSRAFAYLDSALALSRAQGLRQDEASNLELLANLHHDLGNTRRALAVYAEARAINRELGLDYEAGVDLRSEAQIHLELDDLTPAEAKARVAVGIHREIGAPLEEFLDLLLLAEVHGEARRWAEAGEHLSVAREIARRLDARSVRVALAITEARIAEAVGDPREALRILNSAERDLGAARYDAQAEAYAIEARAHAQLGSSEEAITQGRRAVAAVERVRRVLRSSYLRTTYLAQKNRVYSDLVGFLLAAGREEEAFQVTDAARGRALMERVSAASGERGRVGRLVREYAEGEGLLLRINELLSGLDELEEAPPSERDADGETFLLSELQRSRSEYEALLVRVSEIDPAGAAVLGTRSVSVAEMRDALSPDEALLEYLIAEDGVFLFVMRRDDVRSLPLELSPPALAARIRIARELSARPNGESARPVLERLHEDLIRPALDSDLLNRVRRLVIVPHRDLAYLPFAALRDGERGRYLVEDYSLLSIPNAAALAVSRDRGRVEIATRTPQGFAPFPDELPGTRAELDAFQAALPDARMWIGRRASESAVREAMGGGGVVHVASHAVLNTGSPMFSRIELAAGVGSEAEDDGRLEVHELLGVAIRSPLVFLSGCETGVGAAGSSRYAPGEDYAMLAQAFLYAGADNVVATLWRVEDRSASEFATAFYSELRSSDPEVALARAQRRMLADPAYRSPFHWAAYRISGSGGTLLRTR